MLTPSSKILLTGAAGFLGARVRRLLVADGGDVLALRRPGPAPTAGFVECDLGDTARLAAVMSEHRADTIIHLAWFTAPGAYWMSSENLDCVGQALQLLRLAGETGCRRFVGAGTCAEYDWSHENLVERATPCLPRSLYGSSKLAVATLGEQFGALRGVSFAWARYNFLFGRDEAVGRLIGSAIDTLLANRDFACSAGQQVRDYMHVDEAAAATIALAQSDVVGPVNIGSGEPASVRALLEHVATAVGGSGQLLFGARPPAADDPPALVPSLLRLHEEVGWRPQTSLRDGLARTVLERRAA